jgi:Dolichyl-phosphate-mannose-protein mannosyltransferase
MLVREVSPPQEGPLWGDEAAAHGRAGFGHSPDDADTVVLWRDELAAEIARQERAAAPRPSLSARLAPYAALLPILGLQAYFAIRAIPANPSSVEEAHFLYAGHEEIRHLLHGGTVNNYPTYFSGAPLIYPVLAATLDSWQGLDAARGFSLVCVLLATLAVFKTARRAYGTAAGFAAAALFAGLGPSLYVSSYATFDGLALCLIAWATYYTVAFAYADKRTALIRAVGLMVLANCTKYTTVLWDPVIILLAGAAGPGFRAWQLPRSWNAQRFALVSASAIAIVLLLGREPYFTGLTRTVGLRASGTAVNGSSVRDVALWIGPLLAIALVGFLMQLRGLLDQRTSQAEAVTAGLLLAGGVIAPVAQLLLGTSLSLAKQADIGASFAAVLAGLVAARAGAALRRRSMAVAVAVAVTGVLAAPLGLAGAAEANALHDSWPDSNKLVDTLRPLVHRGTADYLVENYEVAAYYLRGQSNWTQWHDPAAARTTVDGKVVTGAPALEAQIAARHYAVIVLDYTETPHTDTLIVPTIAASGYRLKTTITVDDRGGQVVYYLWTLPGAH